MKYDTKRLLTITKYASVLVALGLIVHACSNRNIGRLRDGTTPHTVESFDTYSRDLEQARQQYQEYEAQRIQDSIRLSKQYNLSR